MTRKVGSVSGETKVRLISVAAEEFATKGFQHSSLRRICQNAGVTTGALYFFFENKDDLFKEIVSSVAKQISDFTINHYNAEKKFWENTAEENEKVNIKLLSDLLCFYYKNKGSCDVILNNRSHPVVVNFFEEIIKITTEHHTEIIKSYADIKPRKYPIDEFAIHCFAHQEINILIGLIVHNKTFEDAMVHVKPVVLMMEGAFMGLVN